MASSSAGAQGGTAQSARTSAPGPGSTWICVTRPLSRCPNVNHMPPEARICRATTKRAPPVPRKRTEITAEDASKRLPTHVDAAVDIERLARHVVALNGEEAHAPGDFFGLRHAVHGNAIEDLLL